MVALEWNSMVLFLLFYQYFVYFWLITLTAQKRRKQFIRCCGSSEIPMKNIIIMCVLNARLTKPMYMYAIENPKIWRQPRDTLQL